MALPFKDLLHWRFNSDAIGFVGNILAIQVDKHKTYCFGV